MKLKFCFAALLLLTTSTANAVLVGVSGPNSTLGTAASIIAAPAQVTNASVTNTGQQGFDEAQSVLLGSALSVDGGSIAAGTVVDSHMIFLNVPVGVGEVSHRLVDWTFNGTILGVMSDINGTLEAASTPILGAPGTIYDAPFSLRGLEVATSIDDYMLLAPNVLRVTMNVGQPGDWIRVVTLNPSAVPVPAAVWLFASALIGLTGFSRRRKA